MRPREATYPTTRARVLEACAWSIPSVAFVFVGDRIVSTRGRGRVSALALERSRARGLACALERSIARSIAVYCCLVRMLVRSLKILPNPPQACASIEVGGFEPFHSIFRVRYKL